MRADLKAASLDKQSSWASHDPLTDVWILQVQIQPGARFNEVSGEHAGRLKLKIAAPPVDNKANIALIQFIAGLAGVSPGKVVIKRGEHSRLKTLTVTNAGENLLMLLEQQQKSGNP